MAKHEDDDAPKIKVRRKRRRLYDLAPDSEAITPPEPRKFTDRATKAAEPPAAKATRPRVAKASKPAKPAVPEILDAVETQALAPRGSAELSRRRKAALTAVESNALIAAGVGLLPLPLVDAVALVAIHLGMLKALAEIYGIDYDRQKGKIYVGALLGLLVPVTLLSRVGRLLKFFPGLGQLGSLLVPATTWATTFAIGRIFIHHFESGGTLRDFEPEKMRPVLEEEYAKARASRA